MSASFLTEKLDAGRFLQYTGFHAYLIYSR